MFLTRVLLAPKSKYVLVTVESTVTGHQFCCCRERKGEKKEMIWFDPLVRQSVVYKEVKKMKALSKVKYKPDVIIEIEKTRIADPFDP